MEAVLLGDTVDGWRGEEFIVSVRNLIKMDVLFLNVFLALKRFKSKSFRCYKRPLPPECKNPMASDAYYFTYSTVCAVRLIHEQFRHNYLHDYVLGLGRASILFIRDATCAVLFYFSLTSSYL